MSKLVWLCAPVLAVTTSMACSSDSSAPTESAVVRDSAGIRIVQNVGTADATPPWSVSAEPVWRAGWGDSEIDFVRLWVGVIDGDGRSIVGDVGTNVIHAFDPDGRHIGSIGGEGEGPGEFRQINAILDTGGDSLLVADASNLRLTLVRDMEYVSDTRFQGMLDNGIYVPTRVDRDGTFTLSVVGFSISGERREGWIGFPVLRTRDFMQFDTVAVFPFLYLRERDDFNPIRPHAITFLAGEQVAHARSDRPELVWHRTDGSVEQIARWDAVAREATDEDWAEYETLLRAGREAGPSLEEAVENVRGDYGGTIPLFGRGFADDAGNVWLSEYGLVTMGVRRFDVVSGAGEWRGPVEFPRELRVLDIRDGRVLAFETDDFDVQSLVMYELER